MPLEALRDATFSHKSDVFGFGVLVWEMCTLAKPPWGAFGLQDVVQGLRDGDRLQRPSDCPDQLYDLCKALRPNSQPFDPCIHAAILVTGCVLHTTLVKHVGSIIGADHAF